MEFDFIAARYRKDTEKENHERVLGGFLTLQEAQNFAENKELDFLSNGFMFIDSPQGRYIYGENEYGNNVQSKWYSPEEVKDAIVYDAAKNRKVSIENYLPSNDYHRFTQNSSNSVLSKLQEKKGNVASERSKMDRKEIESMHER